MATPFCDSRILYERSIAIIQMYATHNQGKRSVSKESEEEQFKDILLLMELLNNLLSKDFIDLAPHGNLTIFIANTDQIFHKIQVTDFWNLLSRLKPNRG